MKHAIENNKVVKDGYHFWKIHKLLMDDGNGVATLKSRVGLGPNTYAMFRLVGHDDPQAIVVRFFDTAIAVLLDDGSVILNSGGFMTSVTMKRMNQALLPLDYKLKKIGRTWKVYSMNTGAYRDYLDGMILRRGEF